MKLSPPFRRRALRHAAGFTLPEALIATSVFVLLVLGVVAANLFGLRWYLVGQTSLRATDSARTVIGEMSDELRTCQNVLVGNVSNGVFLAHVNGESQTGNGLMIYATTNTNSYVLYYVNATNQNFVRFTTDLNTNAIVAQLVTNSVVFKAQDYQGNVLTNNQNNRVISCSLQFYVVPPQSPVTGYYQLQTTVAPRSEN